MPPHPSPLHTAGRRPKGVATRGRRPSARPRRLRAGTWGLLAGTCAAALGWTLVVGPWVAAGGSDAGDGRSGGARGGGGRAAALSPSEQLGPRDIRVAAGESSPLGSARPFVSPFAATGGRAPEVVDASDLAGPLHPPHEGGGDDRAAGGNRASDGRSGLRDPNQVRPRDGHFIERYLDGTKAAEGAYEDGERTGEWTTWHPDGGIESVGSYAEGRRVGRWRTYYPGGQPASAGSYEAGRTDGTWTVWYSSGQVKEHGTFQSGLREGYWQFYDLLGAFEPRSGFYRFGYHLGQP